SAGKKGIGTESAGHTSVLLFLPETAIDELAAVCTKHRQDLEAAQGDRKSTRLNSSHVKISYAVFCLKKKKYLRNLNPDQSREYRENLTETSKNRTFRDESEDAKHDMVTRMLAGDID